MATIVLAAAGGAIGTAFGGAVFGISSTIIGQAVGATLGRAIDQRVMGGGSQSVETGKIDRFRLSGASEGAVIPQVYGKMRVSGQVIWSSRFLETVNTTTHGGGGGGKGAPSGPETTVTEYSYSVSLAYALCQGEVQSIGRIWADGEEIPRTDLNLRLYRGDPHQLPDPKIEAVEGAGNVPAFRGTAYVVIEGLQLKRFGNRVPQLSFEVYRNAAPKGGEPHLSQRLPGVALIPGTGEYALATTPVHANTGPGANRSLNVHSPGWESDFVVAERMLLEEVPGCTSTSLVVSWFGDDLRCGVCKIHPKIENAAPDAANMPYMIGNLARDQVQTVPRLNGRPIYGGTPSDRSVIEAIQRLRVHGKHVVYYPFILMDQLDGNSLPDPWSDAGSQPQMPWRGRITLSEAPGRVGSPDKTAQATAEVSAFFGNAQAASFSTSGGQVTYSGTPDFGYRYFVLHNAAVCAAAGGVDAFCIGSEMRSLTQIRDASGYPAVAALKALATDVRAILGPATKIGYAADWSEYFGHHPQDGGGDVNFHLDPLWSDPNIDFIGIDNYMPLSDWRAGIEHEDAPQGSIYSLDYLKSNVAGGEGFDWYYRNDQERQSQFRSPIEDGAHNEPWVFRYKDLAAWWSNPHHNRVGGVRQAGSTSWVPQSKPIWFTEVGCPAIEKGTNQPNKFVDLLSSESEVPYFSSGRRDDLIQYQYLRALLDHWSNGANNPTSALYGGPMVDVSKTHAWAWDTRPWPHFPNNTGLWADGPSYLRGHWVSGRLSAQPLSEVVAEICQRSGVYDYDVSELFGLVRGYELREISSARAALQPLMLVHGFDVIEREGKLVFRSRREEAPIDVAGEAYALAEALEGTLEKARAPEAELAGRVQLNYLEHGGDYAVRTAEAIFPDETSPVVSQSDFAMVLNSVEATGTAERWLAESRVARENVRFALPLSRVDVRAGDLVELEDGALYRVDRLEIAEARIIEATRVASSIYEASDAVESLPPARATKTPLPVFPAFLDLPLLTGDEVPHAPWLAVTGAPWPGSAAVYSSDQDAGYSLERAMSAPSVLGVTTSSLSKASTGVPDRGAPLAIRLTTGALTSVSEEAFLRGQNLAAIGDGSPGGWELLQFKDAVPLASNEFEISHRLRGQLGTEGEMREIWPAGSYFVLLSPAMQQLAVSAHGLGLPRHYRIGPGQSPVDAPSYTHAVHSFEGRGLRPYAPAHLRVSPVVGGQRVRFLRRTRIDGDRWDLTDVPLGETTEGYLIQVSAAGTLLRGTNVTENGWVYTDTDWAADGAPSEYEISVAQLSDRYGPGAFARRTINV